MLSVVLVPLQMIVFPVIVGIRFACTVTSTVVLALQPVVTVTV